MKKLSLLLAGFVGAVCGALPVCAQTTEHLDAPMSAKVVLRNGGLRNALKNDGETSRISEIVARVKANFNAKFRVFEPGIQPAEPDSELAAAEQEYFNENCDQLIAAFEQYRDAGMDDDFEEMLRALGEIKYYQANSPAVAELIETLREYFSHPNLYIEASERFVSAMARQDVKQDFKIQEYIRGSYARGSGVADGIISVDLHPNTERAEMSIVLNTNIKTSTVGTSRGVDVYSDNFGSVLASKRIYVNPDGMFVTALSSANGSMKTRVNSFDANRITPFGGAIIRNKIGQELPLAERESSLRVKQRVAAELEEQVNEQLTAVNDRIKRMFRNGCDPMVRNMKTRTSEDRLYFSCTLGRSWQLAAPDETDSRAIAYMKELSREVGLAYSKTSGFYAEEVEQPQTKPQTQAQPKAQPKAQPAPRQTTAASSGQCCHYAPYPAYMQPRGPVASLLSAPVEIVSSFAYAINPLTPPPTTYAAPSVRVPAPSPSKTLAKPQTQTASGAVDKKTTLLHPVSQQSGPSAKTPSILPATSTSSYLGENNKEHDLVLTFHQSGPNNAATVALAGASFGPGCDTLDAVVARFPGLDIAEVKQLLKPYEPKEDRPLDPEDNYENVTILFDDVRPFLTRFDNGKISTVLRIRSCVVDGKEWPPVEVKFVYNIEKRGDSYAFVREEVEVLPEGYQEGDSVSARFHTFRRIFLKRLEKTISNEYVIVPVSLDDPKTGVKRGALIPENIEVQEGWITAAFRYDPEYSAK